MPASHPSSETSASETSASRTPIVRNATRPAVVSVIASVVANLAAWAQRRRQRHALARLDPHLLRDVGLTRADAVRECGKPFWRR